MKFGKIVGGLVALVVLLVVGLAIFILTFNVDNYRPQIVEVLEKQTGRKVSLGGPIKLGFSVDGVRLSIQDAALGNPSWASRPNMAGIGRFDLGVALMPLLNHRLEVTEVKIVNADIQLETNASNQNNWEIKTAGGTPSKASVKSTPNEAGKTVAVQIKEIAVKDSQLAIRGKDGKLSIFKTKSFTVGSEAGGSGIHFDGEYNGLPVKLDVKSDARDIFATTGPTKIEAEIAYDRYLIKARGETDFTKKTSRLDNYNIKAGGSDLHGQATVKWSGVRPSITGTLISEKFDPADLKPSEAAVSGKSGDGKAKTEAAPAANNSERLFSDAPLPLDDLKALDATMDVQVTRLNVGDTSLSDIATKLVLAGGKLSMEPFKARLGKAILNGDMVVNAATSPAHASMAVKAPGVELEELLQLGSLGSFLSGKGDMEMSFSGTGNSLHEMASSANGRLTVIAEGGKVSSGIAGQLSSGLAQLLSAGSNSNPGLNCMAARFVATNGVVRDDGILVDTSVTTISGKGGVNLGSEVVDMNLRARNKLVNVLSLLPALHVGGTLKDLSFSVNPVDVVENVAGILTKASLDGGVPTLASNVPAGQNVCVYTLDHPQPTTTVPEDVVRGAGKAGEQIKNLGGSLLKGLLGGGNKQQQ